LQITADLEARGFPIIDHFYQTDLSKPETRLEEIDHILKNLKPGLTHFITHPAHDTPETRAISGDWAGRVADFEALNSNHFQNSIQENGILKIGYRELRE